MSDYTKYFVPENHIATKDGIASPFGKWLVKISEYKTKKGCDNYSCAKILDSKTNEEILIAYRNYPTFFHQWIIKNNIEYLMCSEAYMGQTCLNPANKQKATMSQPKDENFCWSGPWILSPDGKTLAVVGCYWGAPYEILFYDFSNPMEIPYKNLPVYNKNNERCCLDYNALINNEPENNQTCEYLDKKLIWNNDNTFSIWNAKRQNNIIIATEIPVIYHKDE